MKYAVHTGVAVALTFAVAAAFSVGDPVDETVQVENGTLHGTATESGVLAYKGVPFAAPPVGDLRWRPPQPVGDWEGVRSAEEFGPSCMQDLARSRPPWTEEFMVQGDASEDCLYLNVWTAAEETDEKRPVLVYIHGGGFNEGSGSIDIYDGASLAHKGPVVVTINYRVGPFGFLAHPELTAESPNGASGNYGLLDQVAALEWVRDNIGAFGGDPGRVTIAGQSAGAMSVVLLTASPLAKDLFHRAIVQSGPGALASFGVVSLRGLAGPLSEAEQAGVTFAERKDAKTLTDLRALSADEIMARAEGEQPVRFRTVVDGWFLPDDIAEIYEAGRMNDVPTISGLNADEASAFPGYGEATLEEYRSQAEERYGDRADEYLALYPADTDAEAGESQIASSRDRALVALERLAADRAQTAQTDLYLYYFKRGIPWPEYPDFGAFHTAEVPYVFDNLDMLDRPFTDLDHQIADAMSSYWVNFITSGNPNGEELPDWDPYSASESGFMVFGEDIGMQYLPRPDREEFMESVLSNSGS